MNEPLANPIQTPVDAASLFDFMSETIIAKEDMAKWRTAEAYRSALRSFQQFRKAADIPLPEIDSRLMAAYEAWLGSHGLCPNSRSFYLRILRAVYNRAVEQGLSRNASLSNIHTREWSARTNAPLNSAPCGKSKNWS